MEPIRKILRTRLLEVIQAPNRISASSAKVVLPFAIPEVPLYTGDLSG
ncbi:2594_t:CDS:2, partial [Acaulospora colombiana]